MADGKLSALKVKNLIEPGRYGDGGGLWFQVRDASHRSWLFRYTLLGRSRAMGLGPYPDVSLADARAAAKEERATVRRGIDPIEERNRAQSASRAARDGITFRQATDRYLTAHEATWRNAKHRYQWRATLDTACDTIGAVRVADIATADVTKVLEPIWRIKPETASRLRGRMEAVIDYATAHGWRTGDNPARWRGHLAKILPAIGKIAKVKHHPALPWRETSVFMEELRKQEGIAARALEYTILTAARTGEAIGAKWPEIDMSAAIWICPPERMKSGLEHRVPLIGAAMEVLEGLLPLRNPHAGDWVFPGGKPGRGLSNMGMLMMLRRIGRSELTVHGFRSAFKDWASEATDYPNEVVEQALAHVIGSVVERAYRRGDMFEKRRKLMEDWAIFCSPHVCDASTHSVAVGKL